MNELTPTNAFGELLLDLIEAQYDGDIDSGINAIMQTTGMDEEEVVAIIQGDVIVEDEALLYDLVEAFPDADDEDMIEIINTATAVDEADRMELIETIEAEEGAAEEAQYMHGMSDNADFQARADVTDYASFAAEEAQAARFEAQSAQQQLAEFQMAEALKAELKNLESEASLYVAQETLPPSFKAMLIGNFSDDTQRMARFSQIAEGNGVDVPTMLFATRYAFEILKDASRFVEFTDYSVSEEEVALANFSAGLDSMCEADINAIFGDK